MASYGSTAADVSIDGYLDASHDTYGSLEAEIDQLKREVQRLRKEAEQRAKKLPGTYETEPEGEFALHALNYHLDDMDISPIDSNRVMSYLYGKFTNLGDEKVFSKLLKENLGDVTVSVLRTAGDIDYELNGPIVNALRHKDGTQRAARTFQSLMKYRRGTEFEMHEPNLPYYSTAVILYSLDWLLGDNMDDVASLSYHVLQELFGRIGVCYLINEQLRLMQCICIWISCHAGHFTDGTLLRVLIDGAIVTLVQPELSYISRGILEWSFHNYAKNPTDNAMKLEDACIRICSIARQFSTSYEFGQAGVNGDLLSWIESQMLYLGQTNTLQKGIAVALAAWPRDLEGDLAVWYEGLSCNDLSAILKDEDISLHKFKLVRRLSALADESNYTKHQYSTEDFWSLKGLIPQHRLPDDEMGCFINLLLQNAGCVESRRADNEELRHSKTLSSKTHQNASSSVVEIYKYVKDNIIVSLLHMLSGDSSAVVYSAYKTLRRIAWTTDFEFSMMETERAKYRRDVLLLKPHAIQSAACEPADIRSLLDSELLEACCDFTIWISKFTKVVCGVLSARDVFFSYLGETLEVDRTFSEATLSILIYALLSNPALGNAKIKSDDQKFISQHFNQLLRLENTDTRCIRSIIDVVLHIRQFKPVHSKDALAHDRWLEMDFVALSRGAIKCGAFTTALLFIEFASEYNKLDINGSIVEEILFQIYDHLDEPDGFYGIKFSNLEHFLLKRFRHEQQWEKALSFHGAEFEAGGSIGIGGVLESLHSFGFDNLATTALQSDVSSDERLSLFSEHLNYEFGWRTENWSLSSSSGSDNSSANLYAALRAVHCERNTSVIRETIQNSIYTEMQNLRSLGNENLVQIRQSTRTLMCLAQARQWMMPEVQQDIASKIVNEKVYRWHNYHSISTEFEYVICLRCKIAIIQVEYV